MRSLIVADSQRKVRERGVPELCHAPAPHVSQKRDATPTGGDSGQWRHNRPGYRLLCGSNLSIRTAVSRYSGRFGQLATGSDHAGNPQNITSRGRMARRLLTLPAEPVIWERPTRSL